MPTATLPGLDLSRLDALRRRGNTVLVPDAGLLSLPERAVQFGTGAFLRGFIDDFLQRANEQGTFGGRVVVIGSTAGARDAAINAQQGLYTLVVEGIERGEPVQECRIVGSVSRALSAADQWPEVLALARAPLLRYVFSNTTEVGIALDTGDRYDADPPRSFPGKLTRFLHERALAHRFNRSAGLVVIPCELIDDNATRLREIVLDLADRWSLGGKFAEWIDGAVVFCNTLVDRIVPGTPRGDEARRLTGRLGYEDALLTICEPYRLLAIEGDERLRDELSWAAADPAIIVKPDIRPYRERKVRLLNGAHTLVVSAALQMGLETVRDAVTQPALRQLLRRAMFDEIVPTLDVDGAEEFAEAVLERFANPFIRHVLVDLTLHGTMKMRVRVVPSIVRYAERMGRAPDSLAFGFATLLSFMRGDPRAARADDRANRLRGLWHGVATHDAGAIGQLVESACGDATLWGTDLTSVPGFTAAVSAHLVRACDEGIAAALDHHLVHPLMRQSSDERAASRQGSVHGDSGHG